MSFGDLVFIILFLGAASTAIVAAGFALGRQFGRARRIIFRLLAASAAYMAVVITVSAIAPRRVAKIGDPHCFDDWCVAVAGFRRTADGPNTRYTVDLRLYSRARRVSQRENNLAVSLTDGRGRRYDPVAGESSVPFNVLLEPGDSVMASRSFLVPAEAAEVGIVISHEGGIPITWFIVGYDTWFRKPPAAKLE
jgi:hypothetical protein